MIFTTWKFGAGALAVVIVLTGLWSLLRQLPTQAEEGKAQVKAIVSLVSGLKESLPAADPVILAKAKANGWAEQPATKGKVTVRVEDLKEMIKQLDAVQASTIKVRASWTATESETTARAAKVESMIGNSVWPEQLRAFFRASKDLVVLLGWPIAILLAVSYLIRPASANSSIGQLTRSIQKLTLPGGFELTLWGDDFRQSQSDMFKKYRADVQAEYDKLAERYTIKETVTRILEGTVTTELKRIKPQAVDYRATIHVRDALFTNAYYQLIDYLPTGGNRGRAWSVRYGMVGRYWRLERSGCEENVSNGGDKLISEWGMTRSEAQGQEKHTMLCCLLKSNTGEPVGAFYMDAKEPKAFGTLADMQALEAKLRAAAETTGLRQSLEAIWEDIKKKAPRVEIYGNRT